MLIKTNPVAQTEPDESLGSDLVHIDWLRLGSEWELDKHNQMPQLWILNGIHYSWIVFVPV